MCFELAGDFSAINSRSSNTFSATMQQLTHMWPVQSITTTHER